MDYVIIVDRWEGRGFPSILGGGGKPGLIIIKFP